MWSNASIMSRGWAKEYGCVVRVVKDAVAQERISSLVGKIGDHQCCSLHLISLQTMTSRTNWAVLW